jgi:hypothetical protein
VFGSHEKITKCKNQSLANAAGIWQCPVAVVGFWRENLIGSGHNGRIRSYSAGIFRIRPYSVGSIQIRPNPGRFGQSWPDSSHFGQIRPAWPEYGGQHPAPAGYRRPDVVGLQRRLDSDDRQLLNYDNRISNVRVKMKSLILKNDLRF